jgi:uncharacterized protein YciI
MTEPTHELEAYFADTADAEQVRTVEAWIQADPTHAKAFMAQLHFRELVCQHMREPRNETSAVLAELAQLEALADADTVTLVGELPAEHGDDPGSLSVVGGYVLRKALANKTAVITSICSAAAALLLVFTLINPFAGKTPEPIAQTDRGQEQADDQTERLAAAPLATLTAEQNAQWESDFDYGRPELGDVFRAGRELTLLAGFAELTTSKDVVVVLEAPCKIVFDEADNALRLQAGRLVADVPEQAVGFTVHTPTARVIDYGTRFGVEVHEDGSTNAAVFTGEVELSELPKSADQPTRNVRLTEGWASQVSSKGVLHREPRVVSAEDLSRFANSVDEIIDPAFAYRRAVLANGPVVYWGFGEGKDQTRNLAGQAQSTGRAIGQIDHDNGIFGSALKLTGQVESMNGFGSANPFKLKTTSAYTLEAWYRADQSHWGRVLSLTYMDPSLQAGQSHLSLVEMLGGENISQQLAPERGKTRFFHRSQPDQDAVELFSQAAAPVGQWTHLVAVREGNTSRLYINGEQVGEQRDDQEVFKDVWVNLNVGSLRNALAEQDITDPSVFRTFQGLIDEVAVYDHALEADQIASHYQIGIQQSPRSDE